MHLQTLSVFGFSIEINEKPTLDITGMKKTAMGRIFTRDFVHDASHRMLSVPCRSKMLAEAATIKKEVFQKEVSKEA